MFEWKASPGTVVVIQSLMIHVVNSKIKWKNKRRASISFISLFFPFSGSFLTGGYKLVCVCDKVLIYTHTAAAPRGDQDPPRKSNKNNTLTVSSAVKTGGEGWEGHEVNKD